MKEITTLSTSPYSYWYIIQHAQPVSELHFHCLEPLNSCRVTFSLTDCAPKDLCSPTCSRLQQLETLSPSFPSSSFFSSTPLLQGSILCSTVQLFAQTTAEHLSPTKSNPFSTELTPVYKSGNKFVYLTTKGFEFNCSFFSLEDDVNVIVQKK
eukprot:snap_masked-scaffold_79-processed-gene-0.30-mRNA-1 protein AED:1.00 eAED:1.00 QI:0/0/0/0/1/1/2/0/152